MSKKFFSDTTLDKILKLDAFTLVELLVVVLIIGILAAIALPQYRKTVEKAHVADATITIRALEGALERYLLENGFNTSCEIESLDVALPGNTYNQEYFTYYTECDPEFSIYEIRAQRNNFEYLFTSKYIRSPSDAVGQNVDGSAWVSNGNFMRICMPTMNDENACSTAKGFTSNFLPLQ